MYLALLRQPSVLRLMASQLLARLPLGLLALSVLIYIQAETNKYALAGIVVGFMSIGEAIAIPLTSRFAVHFGVRSFLWVICVLNAIAMVLFIVVGSQEIVLILLGLIAGLTTPPLAAVVRSIFPLLVDDEETRTLFALDAAAQELIWIVGPVLAAASAALMGASAPLIVCAVIAIGGAAWFLTSPALKKVTIPTAASKFGHVLTNRSLVTGILVVFPLVASFTSGEVGLLKFFNADVFWLGVAVACSGIGSLIGGLIFGPRKLGLAGTAWMAIIIAIGTAMIAFTTEQPVLFVIAMLLSGFGFAPALSALMLMISHAIPHADSAESFGWMNTAGLIGAAAGTAIGGIVADAFGFGATMLVASAMSVVSVLLLFISRGFGPIPGLSKSVYEPQLPQS